MYEDQPVNPPTVDRPAAETWCHWHDGYTDTGRLITVEEQNSGPGYHRYACAPCREKHGLRLWVESAGA